MLLHRAYGAFAICALVRPMKKGGHGRVHAFGRFLVYKAEGAWFKVFEERSAHQTDCHVMCVMCGLLRHGMLRRVARVYAMCKYSLYALHVHC